MVLFKVNSIGRSKTQRTMLIQADRYLQDLSCPCCPYWAVGQYDIVPELHCGLSGVPNLPELGWQLRLVFVPHCLPAVTVSWWPRNSSGMLVSDGKEQGDMIGEECIFIGRAAIHACRRAIDAGTAALLSHGPHENRVPHFSRGEMRYLTRAAGHFPGTVSNP